MKYSFMILSWSMSKILFQAVPVTNLKYTSDPPPYNLKNKTKQKTPKQHAIIL